MVRPLPVIVPAQIAPARPNAAAASTQRRADEAFPQRFFRQLPRLVDGHARVSCPMLRRGVRPL